jgi:hypothetical protein
MSEYLKWGQLSTKKRPGRQRFFALSQASLPARLLATCRLPSILAAMTIAELIYEQVKRLPDPAAREVLDFVGYIRERGERSDWRDLMNAQSASLAPVWDNSEDQIWDNA